MTSLPCPGTKAILFRSVISRRTLQETRGGVAQLLKNVLLSILINGRRYVERACVVLILRCRSLPTRFQLEQVGW